MAFAPLLAGIGSGAAGALFQKFGSKQKQAKQPRFQRELIDQLMQGLQGQGQFASLFQQGGDLGIGQEAFQTSVADPLMQQFQSQTAPGIQQKFIASGQQGGTPLESALSRAGLDVQGQINQLFLPFQQGQQQFKFQQEESQKNRVQQAIQQLLGIQAPQQQTQLTPFGAGAGGFLQSGAIKQILKSITGGGGGTAGVGASFNPTTSSRRGFSGENTGFFFQ